MAFPLDVQCRCQIQCSCGRFTDANSWPCSSRWESGGETEHATGTVEIDCANWKKTTILEETPCPIHQYILPRSCSHSSRITARDAPFPGLLEASTFSRGSDLRTALRNLCDNEFAVAIQSRPTASGRSSRHPDTHANQGKVVYPSPCQHL